MIFRREPQVTLEQLVEMWRIQQMTTLALAHLTLQIMRNPELVTDELQSDVTEMICGLEDRLAQLQEHFV